ncbi:MAG: hypothetical protein OEZ38_01085 [Gammaproteobacteria bacterium]|nr:hypothetical protein [Gammaproteobacteria bacterium]
MTVYHWDKKEFIASYAFTPDDEGLKEFRNYICATDNSSTKILIDLIEESFEFDSIPHVGSADRKSIMKRRAERVSRNSKDYIYYKLIDRENAGRRDDIVFLSILTNPSLFSPWISIIEQEKVAVAGIWTLPLITNRFIEKIRLDVGNVLIVSRQVPSNIRQTYFKNGNFKNSRSASINLYETNFEDCVFEEIEQSLRYLTNQKLIGFDEKVDVHLMCDESEISEIENRCENTPLVTYHFHRVAELEKLFNVGGINSQFCSGLFSSICRDERFTSSHYGPKPLFKYFYQKIIEKGIRYSGMAVIVISTVMSMTYITNGIALSKESIVLKHKAEAMESAYKKQLQKLEPELKRSRAMMSSVLFYERVSDLKMIAPQSFMNELSRVLASIGMRNVSITRVSWKRTQGNGWSKFKRGDKKKIDTIRYGDSEQIKHKAIVTGFIRGASVDKKSAVEKIEKMFSVLKNDSVIEDVNIIKMGMDLRPEKEIENESNIGNITLSKDIENGMFEIEILMKGGSA